MRKVTSLVLSLMAVCAMATASFGAFTTVVRSTFSASVQFSATGMVQVSYELRNISGDALATSISWNVSGITLGTTKWKAADQYIVMHTTMTAAAGGIQIYTDNKAADAAPYTYTGVSTATAAGLVGYDAAYPAASSTTLPMCWRVVDVATTTINIQQGAPGYPDRLYDQTLGNLYPCFLWMTDKFTGGFVNSMDYITVKDAQRGIQHAEANWGTTASPDYIYFGANFANAVTPRTYRTNTLRLEAFTE